MMCKTSIPTKDLDIVYFVKAFPTRDLLYSIRSAAQNLEYRKLWIIGGKLQGLEPDGYIPRLTQSGNTKWNKVRTMYRDVCISHEISDDFILFYDDFFVMQPTTCLEYAYRGSLEAHYRAIERAYGPLPNEYSKILRKAHNALLLLGKTTLSYEIHTPFVFNKHKLLEIMGIFPNMNCVRSLYANYWELGGAKTKDVKIYSDRANFDWQRSAFLSTDDGVSKEGNECWRYITSQFNTKCKYERG